MSVSPASGFKVLGYQGLSVINHTRSLLQLVFTLIFIFETRVHRVALAGRETFNVGQAGFKLREIYLPLPPERWG